MDEELYMKLAIEEAEEGIKRGEGGPFGAVVVEEGEVLSKAHNTVLKDNDPTRHAEIKAISEAAGKKGSFDLSGCVIYSTTEPCPMCFSAIHWARISRIVYGTGIEDVKRLGFNELAISAAGMKEKGASDVEITGSFMRAECIELLKKWEALPGKEVY